MSRLDHRLEPAGPVRRLELISGAMGRRRWSVDDRARILEETLAPGAVVSVVARRHGLTPQQLFTWRRQARESAETLPAFVPAVIVPEPTAAAPEPRRVCRRLYRLSQAAIVAFVMAPSSQELEPPANPARFSGSRGVAMGRAPRLHSFSLDGASDIALAENRLPRADAAVRMPPLATPRAVVPFRMTQNHARPHRAANKPEEKVQRRSPPLRHYAQARTIATDYALPGAECPHNGMVQLRRTNL